MPCVKLRSLWLFTAVSGILHGIMFKGIAFALAACLIWGMIFVVPEYMSGFGTMEIALGRYLFYGAISLPFFLVARIRGGCRYPLAVWIKVLIFSLVCTFGYYVFMVFALRCSSAAICALISGVCPIVIAFYGNWLQKEVKFRSLVLPSILIVLGLLAINAPQLSSSESTATYVWGILSAFVAVGAWSWYVVANSRFLKSHPEVQLTDWSTLIGIGALFWTVILGALYFICGGSVDVEKFTTPGPLLMRFVTGCAILGFCCSWLGAVLWNRAAFYLPVSLAGQLTIFETIFAVVFAYALKVCLPPAMECVGIALFLLHIITPHLGLTT